MTKSRMFADSEKKRAAELLKYLLQDEVTEELKTARIRNIIDGENAGRQIVLIAIDLINIRLKTLTDEADVWKYQKTSPNNQGVKFNFETNTIEYEPAAEFTQTANEQIAKRNAEAARLNAIKDDLSVQLDEEAIPANVHGF